MNKPLRVMIVDDSLLYRKVIRDVLNTIPGVDVVGHASNGLVALQKIPVLKPDLLTLDVEMPEKDGIGVLGELRRQGIEVGAIMLSSLSESAAQLTTAALDLGAFDFVLKPSDSNREANATQLRQDLSSKIEAYGMRYGFGRVSTHTPSAKPTNSAAITSPKAGLPVQPSIDTNRKPISSVLPQSQESSKWETPENPINTNIIVIGISTGGPAALAKLIPRLPADLPVPVVIVQHMPPLFTNNLAKTLDESSELKVYEAEPGQTLEPGSVYIAPGGKQLKISNSGARRILRVTEDPPENNCRPSVDYLFRSVAELYGRNALGIIMTGMGNDGTAGCQELASRGARILLQDEQSCVVYGMPRAAAESGIPHECLSLDRIARRIEEIVGVPSCS